MYVTSLNSFIFSPFVSDVWVIFMASIPPEQTLSFDQYTELSPSVLVKLAPIPMLYILSSVSSIFTFTVIEYATK